MSSWKSGPMPRWFRRPVSVGAVVVLALLLPLVAVAPARAADDAGRIDARFVALGGATGLLGAPTTEVYDAGPDGRARDYAGGRIFWSPGTDAWEVLGAVGDRYLAVGGPVGYLGFPTAAATAPTTADGGLEQVFSGGRILSSAATGPHAVSGAVLIEFLTIGATVSYLGYPTSDTTAAGDGFVTSFQRGTITWSPGAGSVVTGAWVSTVRRATAAEMPFTYRSGCPVPPARLRRIVLPYYDWNDVPRFGTLVANASVVSDLQRVFRKAFAARFPIKKMDSVDLYRGNDVVSMAADNTSAFNCRKVTGNPYRLSQHSYGNAIDINTVENPYVTSSRVYPSRGVPFLKRSVSRKGMILPGTPIASAMAAEGWPWGARWSHPDYQHFSSNGG